MNSIPMQSRLCIHKRSCVQLENRTKSFEIEINIRNILGFQSKTPTFLNVELIFRQFELNLSVYFRNIRTWNVIKRSN